MTGFYDDDAIPTWAKGAVSAALLSGAVQGSRDASGAPVFRPEEAVTLGEATVILDCLLGVSDVPVQVFAPSGQEHWAGQAAANLTACGVMSADDAVPSALSQTMTRRETAQLLDGALDLIAARSGSGLF